MSLTASVNDDEYVLVFKATQNLYDFSVNFGVPGLNPPVLGRDTKDTLLKKAVYYTAAFTDSH